MMLKQNAAKTAHTEEEEDVVFDAMFDRDQC